MLPDIVFFTGDQLYEWWPTPIDMTDAMPDEDYLYKWMIWHWSSKDVTSRAPCLVQTDDLLQEMEKPRCSKQFRPDHARED